MESEKVCSGGDTLIFACSGAADVGQLADLTARRLTKEGCGQMFCLAGLGGRVQPIIQKTAAAKTIIAIDGCGMNCTQQCLEMAGFDKYIHVKLADIGMEKGQSPATDENIETCVNAVINAANAS